MQCVASPLQKNQLHAATLLATSQNMLQTAQPNQCSVSAIFQWLLILTSSSLLPLFLGFPRLISYRTRSYRYWTQLLVRFNKRKLRLNKSWRVLWRINNYFPLFRLLRLREAARLTSLPSAARKMLMLRIPTLHRRMTLLRRLKRNQFLTWLKKSRNYKLKTQINQTCFRSRKMKQNKRKTRFRCLKMKFRSFETQKGNSRSSMSNSIQVPMIQVIVLFSIVFRVETSLYCKNWVQ